MARMETKASDIGNMFADDPVFKGTHRDSRGRFATEERAMYDKTKRENIFLRYQVEKYKRLAEQVTAADKGVEIELLIPY
jgi:hypothetical protein